MKDAKGKEMPAWARHIKEIASSTLYAGVQKNSQYVPFAIFCESQTTVEFTPIDNDAAVTMVLGAGYHPIAAKSVAATHANKIFALFAYNPD